jgi:hypothetical protein
MRLLSPAAWPLTLLLAGLVLFASCAGGVGTPRGQGAVAVSCDGIEKLPAYRYTVKLRLDRPQAAAQPGAETPTPAPLTALAGALQNLFSDFTLDGAFISPGRSQAILRFEGEELELRLIDKKSWLRAGATWQQDESQDIGFMTPVAVCQEVVTEIAPSLGSVEPAGELLNGIQSSHYRLDETQLQRLPEVLGESLPQHYVVDVWLARDGRWPVALDIESSDVNEKGQPLGFSFTMNIRDIGDRGISIEPPAVGAGE